MKYKDRVVLGSGSFFIIFKKMKIIALFYPRTCLQSILNLQEMALKYFVFACLLAIYVCTSVIKKPVSLAVTVYNNDFAIVKDVREISFKQGRSDLHFTDVSTSIQPETVTFKALQNEGKIKVYEQNYEANLVNTNSILQKYINKNIQIVARLGSYVSKINGILLGYSSGYILRTKKGIQVYKEVDSIQFPSLPEGFLTVPTLTWKVYSNQTTTTNCQVAYRTTGFSWKADYSLVLNDDESLADVGGWVTIDNYSGKRYRDAKLKLIAGDVYTVGSSQERVYRSTVMAQARESAPSFTEQSFSDFHMYTLSQPVTLNQNEKKQIEFMPEAFNVSIRKYHLVNVNVGGSAESDLRAFNRIEFDNNQINSLGIPLPKGIFRVFKTDSADNSLEFVGQDSIDHTPIDQTITLTTGNAFDITANKIVSNYRQYSKNGTYTADLNLTISNHKEIQAEIVVQLNNYYGANIQITWHNIDLSVENVTTNLFRISKIYQPNQTYSYLWTENYVQ